MSILICKPCAAIREMEMPTLQKSLICDLCGSRAMVGEFPITQLNSPENVFKHRSYLNSNDLSNTLALIKSRKSQLLPKIKGIEVSLSKNMVQARVQDAFYSVDVLVKEGLSRKAVETCHRTLNKMQEVLDRSCYCTSEIATKRVIHQNLMAELSALNVKEEEVNVLYKNCIDQIVLQVLKSMVGTEKMHKANEMAKKIYEKQSKK